MARKVSELSRNGPQSMLCLLPKENFQLPSISLIVVAFHGYALFNVHRVKAVSSVNLCMLEMPEITGAACHVTTCATKERMCV